MAGRSQVSRLKSGLTSFQFFAAVLGQPQRVGGKVELVRIDGRKLQRLGAQRAIAAQRLGLDVLDLPGAAIVARYFAAVDDVGIERIGRGIAILLDSHRVPVVKGDAAIVAAAGDARRTGVLLAAADAIGKGIVRGRVIHLRRRLVVPLRPASRRHSAR